MFDEMTYTSILSLNKNLISKFTVINIVYNVIYI